MTETDLEQLKYLAVLAKGALAHEDGSVRQMDLENFFYTYLADCLKDEQAKRFEAFCLKATAVERIDEGLRIAAEQVEQDDTALLDDDEMGINRPQSP